MSAAYVFAGNTLNRSSAERADPEWVRSKLEHTESRFLPFWRLQVLVKVGGEPALAWARRGVLSMMEKGVDPVLLGLDDGVAHFTVDLSALDAPEKVLGLEGQAEFRDVRLAAMELPDERWGVVAQARALVEWHATHRYCSTCGTATESRSGGAMRVCGGCAAEVFPRVNPVAIMLVHQGDRCLLGRQRGWPSDMFSALAGFVEPGESLDEAVRREVLEESGVRVGKVSYHSTQPWPFPSSLMIGCLAEATSDAIVPGDEELEEVRWFDRRTVRRAIEGDETAALTPPPPMAIAHHLIRSWAFGE